MDLSIFKDKVILITGGTGSFGKGFGSFLLGEAKPKKVIFFSRDEFKQFHMQKELAEHDKLTRYFLGDVRDLARLQMAFRGVDIVIHAAALKQVPALEYNPFEAIQTNILGTQNVITAAIDQGVKKVLLISTDKAAEPVSLYGATKLCAEKLFVDSNVYAAGKSRFSVVRYGNVIASRGSIIETLLNGKEETVHITHEETTRFWISLESSYELVTFAIKNMIGGEIFIPRIPSMRLVDLFKILAPKAKRKVIGLRPGEKIHEVLLTEEESLRALQLRAGMYVILPSPSSSLSRSLHREYRKKGKAVRTGFKFRSDLNEEWLSPEELKKLLKLEKT